MTAAIERFPKLFLLALESGPPGGAAPHIFAFGGGGGTHKK